MEVCPHCNKIVPSENFALHELRCDGVPIVEENTPIEGVQDDEVQDDEGGEMEEEEEEVEVIENEEGWRCQTCTFVNSNMTSYICEMCQRNRSRGDGGEGDVVVEDGGDMREGEGEGGGWECETCTFRNKPTSLSCEICRVGKNQRPPPTVSPHSSSSSTSRSSSTGGEGEGDGERPPDEARRERLVGDPFSDFMSSSSSMGDGEDIFSAMMRGGVMGGIGGAGISMMRGEDPLRGGLGGMGVGMGLGGMFQMAEEQARRQREEREGLRRQNFTTTQSVGFDATEDHIEEGEIEDIDSGDEVEERQRPRGGGIPPSSGYSYTSPDGSFHFTTTTSSSSSSRNPTHSHHDPNFVFPPFPSSSRHGLGGMGGFDDLLRMMIAGRVGRGGGGGMDEDLMEQLRRASEESSSKHGKRATDEQIDSLEKRVFDEESSQKEEDNDPTTATTCSICLADFQSGEEVKSLPCRHVFHGECIDHWLREKNACPVCRTELT